MRDRWQRGESLKAIGWVFDRPSSSIYGQLARIIGPMAEILIKPAAEKNVSLDDLHQILTEEIPGESEREQFLESMNKLH